MTCLAPTLELNRPDAVRARLWRPAATVQLTATANYSYGSPQNVTGSATWSSSNPSVATVSGGAVMCVATAATSATITASINGGGTGSTSVNCQAPLLQSIVVAPSNPTLTAGSSLQLSATANFSYGPPQIVTGSATWSTSNSSVATVSGGSRDLYRRGQQLRDDHGHERRRFRVDHGELPGAGAEIHFRNTDIIGGNWRDSERRDSTDDGHRYIFLWGTSQYHQLGRLDLERDQRRDRVCKRSVELQASILVFRREYDHHGYERRNSWFKQHHLRGSGPLAAQVGRSRAENLHG